MDEARLRGRENPVIFSAYVFLGEFVGLTLLSFGFAYEISGFYAIQPEAGGCEIGQFGWVPYIANHRPIYCALGPSAAVLTALYYACSLFVLGVAHFLYVWRRERLTRIEQPLRFRISPPLMLLAAVTCWLFGLKNSRGDWTDLTNGSHAPFLFTILGIVIMHAVIVSQRYEPRRDWPWRKTQQFARSAGYKR